MLDMRNIKIILSLLGGMLLASCFPESLSAHEYLVSKGKSDYKIHISKDAAKPDQYAAVELQKYFLKVSGCSLPIVHESKRGDKLIFVGFKGTAESLLNGLKPADFANEEYIIRSDGKQMLIAGGGTRGTLYGVIGYLSDYLNCRWYTREVVKTPKQSTIV